MYILSLIKQKCDLSSFKLLMSILNVGMKEDFFHPLSLIEKNHQKWNESLGRYPPPLVSIIFPFHFLNGFPSTWGFVCDQDTPFRNKYFVYIVQLFIFFSYFLLQEETFLMRVEDVFSYANSNISLTFFYCYENFQINFLL